MTGEGEGMLLILNDVQPDHEDEFNLWYDTEHMQERVLVPGFIAATRYRAISGARQYCALYRTEAVAVFESEIYRQRLAAQSDWSRRMLKTFVDPHRAVGRISCSLGAGAGGFLAILKLPRRPENGLDLASPETLAAPLAAAPGMIAVSVFESVPRLSVPVAEYPPTMRPILTPEDRVLLLEASRPSALTPEAIAGIAGPAAGETEHLGIYAFAWRLAREGLA